MKIAAFDTSSVSGSIALLEGTRLIAELTVGRVGTHSGWLLPAFNALLKDSGVTLSEIDLYAASIGPGSFTGLRIGISTVKGLAWAAGRRAVGVSTLAALAHNLRSSNMPVCPILDARKGEVYAALYEWEGARPRILMEESSIAPDALFRRVKEAAPSGPVIFLGDGLGVYEKAVTTALPDAIIAPAGLWPVRAFNVGLLARESADKAKEANELLPLYLRKSEAEIKAG
ncbi:MAG: tRNA (adenosine(37)-N6)-threonylcarbamoyltransferase complex dimerization subunit type 1 TsaB [Deltaproteobacteria bacterium]|nr:tRNA (adenosine(37)-N6)-threonylcarbamoyltransferase complex dimerization subunit type 1 TsaB [Deltaproteobacteria bacterium]